MKSTGSFFGTGFLLVCLGAAALEGIYISNLVRENQELRTKSAGEKGAVDAKVARELAKHATELRVLRVQNQDLLKLRTELRRLRPMTNELEILRAQVRALSAGATTPQPAPKPAVESNPEIFIPKEEWAFAGFSNPEAAIESVIWAGSQGDLEVFLASLTPDGRAKMEEQAQKQAKSEEDMVAELKQGYIQLTGFRIMEQSVLPDDSVMMRVHLDGQNITERFFFKKIGDDWKMSDSKNDR